jgi:hypothetical protein
MEQQKHTFHLTAFEIGILLGAMERNGLKIRKELCKEVDDQIYKESM